MTVDLTGKVALVTGAGTGIGRATAIAFAAAGAKVVGTGLDPAAGDGMVREVQNAGGEALFVEGDVTDSGSVGRAVAETIEAFGRLDCAFNNAGIAGPGAPAGDYGEDAWRRVIDVNLTGVWLCMKHEIPRMLELGGGSIVNCSSVLGKVGLAGSSAYVASKHGVLGLTKTAALDYATSGIRINAICPGFVHTPMIDNAVGSTEEELAPLVKLEPMGRLGDPEEIARAVVWLCSDDASFMTGESMVVDGGWIAGYRLSVG